MIKGSFKESFELMTEHGSLSSVPVRGAQGVPIKNTGVN